MSSDTFATLTAATPTLSVGVLTADLLSLGSELTLLEDAGVAVAHVDVMDGCFCPMMTVGPPFVKALRTRLLKDVHLMIDEPLAKVGDYVAAGADVVTVHVEASRHVHRVLQQLGGMANANDPDRGVVRGVALNPGTPVEAIEPVVGEIELVLVLAVNPGWSGQKFIGGALTKVRSLRQMIDGAGLATQIEVDGGVTAENAPACAAAGANVLVAATAVFNDRASVAENVGRLRAALAGGAGK